MLPPISANTVDGISIHALRVEGDARRCTRQLRTVEISIHALRVEGDPFLRPITINTSHFYPRPPGGGRPPAPMCKRQGWLISIHALRVEGDILLFLPYAAHFHFYPRPPGGGRPRGHSNVDRQLYFYPRPPGGGRQQKRTKFSSVFAQKGEEFASLRRGKRKICRWRFKKDKFWVLIWCEGSGKSVCALASHCG